jgi:hypothetical protein
MTQKAINIFDTLERKHNYIFRCLKCLLEMLEDMVNRPPVNYIYQIKGVDNIAKRKTII